MATLTPIIIGTGGHGRDIAACFDPPIPIRAHHKDLGHFDFRDLRLGYPCIIAVNDPATRANIATEIEIDDIAWVHPDARLYVDCEYGYGTHINYGAMMTRTTLGHHCTIGPGVHMAGDITIGNRVFIGIGAIIGNLVTIGDDAIIGAGSVVLKDVPAGTKVLGVWA